MVLIRAVPAGLALATLLIAQDPVRRVDGYRGIWFTLGQFSEYGDKYSGGLGTYTAKHHPLALYAPTADTTFFVYGGTTQADERHLLAMIGAYDHATGLVEKPVVVHDKLTVNDPHDNPSLSIGEDGRLWVFVSGRGRRRPGFIYRSLRPYSIDGFEQVLEDEFTYPQPWRIPGEGFLLLHTKYTDGRELYWRTSKDGSRWGPARKLVSGGHYQMSRQHGKRVATAFNHHPGGVVDQRTNLYYLETDDLGETWRTVDGRVVSPPLDTLDNPALVGDYKAQGRLVYLKDLRFDAEGNPVALYITSNDHRPGPQGDPRTWTIAHHDGAVWRFCEVAPATHNYDMGSLRIEPDGAWTVIGPLGSGPQRWGQGGEIAMIRSSDQGRTWTRLRGVTENSPRNHSYVRLPLEAHPDFGAFWADGDPGGLSRSRLYFMNRDGSRVRMLPYEMEGMTAEPEEVPWATR